MNQDHNLDFTSRGSRENRAVEDPPVDFLSLFSSAGALVVFVFMVLYFALFLKESISEKRHIDL